MRLCGVLPLQNKIVFSSHAGKYFSDSPMAIFEELRSRGLRCRCVWLSVEPDRRLEGARTVGFASLRACYHLATAKVWVDNVRKPIWVRKRAGQFYVQTWHSGITNKSGERDEEAKINRTYARRARHDSEMADLFVSGSRWQTEHYRRAFWYDGEILESGLPRSDVFFRPKKPVCARVRKYFGLGEGERLLLYAPTFRDSNALDIYDLDCARLVRTLEARFGGTWKVLMRLHPNLAHLRGAMNFGDGVLDATEYPEINELIVACEWLVTDYSSCIFDALEAGTRGLIYATDVEQYRRERGFYFAFEELPFHLSTENDDLNAYLAGFDEQSYSEAAARFLERCGLFDDGRAASRVADRITRELKR